MIAPGRAERALAIALEAEGHEEPGRMAREHMIMYAERQLKRPFVYESELKAFDAHAELIKLWIDQGMAMQAQRENAARKAS